MNGADFKWGENGIVRVRESIKPGQWFWDCSCDRTSRSRNVPAYVIFEGALHHRRRHEGKG